MRVRAWTRRETERHKAMTSGIGRSPVSHYRPYANAEITMPRMWWLMDDA